MINKEIVDQWREKNKRVKGYVHFDTKKSSLSVNIDEYITDPGKIVTHSFYPFLQTEIVFKKFNKQNPTKPKKKIRTISYSSHIDRLIYSYYSQILNNEYNKYANENCINDNSIAYRSNLKKNNIHFAKDVFDFIRQNERCFIMVGDFSSFFDNLDHLYLKEQLCKVLNVTRLSKDWYAIFKTITEYSYCKLEDIKKILGMTYSELNQKDRIFTTEEFRNLRKQKKLNIYKNKNVGIPQGSAISAVLANVYMIDFDAKMKEYVSQFNGNYFRYSDDFIIIIPLINRTEITQKIEITKKIDISKNIEVNTKINIDERIEIKKKLDRNSIKKAINDILSEAKGVKIAKEKTKFYIYQNNILIDEENTNQKVYLDYLGFSFDGHEIYLRDKTLSKYYYRMYRKIKTIIRNNGITHKNNVISCADLYDKYSIKKKREKGNFITYIQRIEKIFGKNDSKNISCIKYRHLKKIKNRLKQI